MALTHFTMPVLPLPPSWFPGHMMKFTRMLPALLTRTDVVLEIRDSRLPLTSINRTLEGALRKWRIERGWDPNNPTRRIIDAQACEHIVVLNKRDLVPEWGMEPFSKAMAKKFPTQNLFFASWRRPRDIRDLSETLLRLLTAWRDSPDLAKKHPHAIELNVLVIGMPNVGKSTLLNALRSMGIKGRTPKALQTSSNPGMTQALSTRLKLSVNPLVYAFDSPGVMLPFLGHGAEGAERGVKLALIAGIKEGLYDVEALAAYLLYGLNVLNPISPAYLHLLPPGTPPTNDFELFLELLAQRMGMIKRGAIVDTSRAAVFFVQWWRDEGGLLAASTSLPVDAPSALIQGWGFDFQWNVRPQNTLSGQESALMIQEKMEQCIDEYMETTDREEREENNVSQTNRRKQMILEEKAKRKRKLGKH